MKMFIKRFCLTSVIFSLIISAYGEFTPPPGHYWKKEINVTIQDSFSERCVSQQDHTSTYHLSEADLINTQGAIWSGHRTMKWTNSPTAMMLRYDGSGGDEWYIPPGWWLEQLSRITCESNVYSCGFTYGDPPLGLICEALNNATPGLNRNLGMAGNSVCSWDPVYMVEVFILAECVPREDSEDDIFFALRWSRCDGWYMWDHKCYDVLINIRSGWFFDPPQ